METDVRRAVSAAGTWLGIVAAAALLSACGAAGPAPGGTTDARARSAAQARASASANAEGESDAEDGATRQARVQQGLAIAPVPLDTHGLTGRQRMLVGLGSYLVNAAGDCTGCHGSAPGQYLAGGTPFALDAAGHVVFSRNLTPDATTGLHLTLDQFREALRTGRDFHAGQTAMLMVMPWMYVRWQSDLDLEAIYAYLRAIPAVRNDVPPDRKDGLGLPAAIPFPQEYTDGDVVRPLPGDTRSFDWRRGLAVSPRAIPASIQGSAQRAYGVGSYIANATVACTQCHTHPDRAGTPPRIDTAAFLTGGTVYVTPPPLRPVTGYVRAMSANLEGARFGFLSEPDSTYARFRDIIRTGTLVDEYPPRPLAFPMFMIAHGLRNLLEDDLHAVYTYLDATARTTGAFDLPRQPPARFCTADAACGAGETCNLATSECVGSACSGDADCGACQTCNAGACQAPAPDSACLLTAH